MDPEFKHIPEYDLNDSMKNRLVALVRLEQHLDSRTYTKEIVEDLKKILALAKENNERRIITIASLMIDHSKHYFK